VSVTLRLPRAIAEEIERRASEAGVSIEEYLLDITTRDIDPVTAAEKYIVSAQQLLDEAANGLAKGNLRQASEKIWGACALAVKAHALAKKGTRLESHRDLWVYKNEIAKELGGWVRIAFKLADSMHRNFYEDWATREDVEDVLKEVERLVRAIAESIERSTSERPGTKS